MKIQKLLGGNKEPTQL